MGFSKALNRYWDGWLPELVAIIFSTLCLFGLVVLLSQCDQKPTFNWHGVTVNALVALLSTLSRASLMAALANIIGQTKWVQFMRKPRSLFWLEVVDGASRDAWGRMSLLLRSPFGIATLGVIGALLTLGFDPFTQQLVSTEARLTFTNETVAAIPRAVRYSHGLLGANSTLADSPERCDGSPESDLFGSHATADFSMQAAILNGIRNGSTPEQLGVNSRLCATGNCTWEAYNSLAVCNQCYVLNDKIKEIVSLGQQMTSVAYVPGGSTYSENSTALVLPNELYLSNIDNTTWGGDFDRALYQYPEVMVNPIPILAMAAYGTSEPGRTNAFHNASTLIWAQSFLRIVPPQMLGRNETKPWPQTNVEALECGLYWCVKEYHSSIVNGNAYETTTQPNHDEIRRDKDSWQVNPPNQTQSVVAHALGHRPPPIPILTPAQLWNLSGTGCLSRINRTDLRLNGEFNVTIGAVWGTTQFLSDTLTLREDVNEPQDPDKWNDTHRRPQKFNGWYGLPYNAQYGPVVMNDFFREPNLTKRFDTLATSMSNSLRSYADQNDQAYGSTGYIHVVVIVRWAWIAFPAAVWLFAVLQLFITIAVTKQSGAPIWKSSALALLSRGEQVSRLLNQQGTISQIEHAAKQHHDIDLFPDGIPEKKTMSSRRDSPTEREDGRNGHTRKRPDARVRGI